MAEENQPQDNQPQDSEPQEQKTWLSKHEKRLNKLREKKEEEKKKEISEKKKGSKNIYFVAILVIALGAYFFLGQGQNNQQSATGNVASSPPSTANYILPKTGDHWHSYPVVKVCGEEKTLPYPTQGIMGTEGLHTHAPPENYVHIEAPTNNPEDIMLGRYFDYLNVKFTATSISWGSVNVKNGDKCPNGSEGKLKVTVDGKEVADPRSVVLQDQQKIDIVFG